MLSFFSQSIRTVHIKLQFPNLLQQEFKEIQGCYKIWVGASVTVYPWQLNHSMDPLSTSIGLVTTISYPYQQYSSEGSVSSGQVWWRSRFRSVAMVIVLLSLWWNWSLFGFSSHVPSSVELRCPRWSALVISASGTRTAAPYNLNAIFWPRFPDSALLREMFYCSLFIWGFSGCLNKFCLMTQSYFCCVFCSCQ